LKTTGSSAADRTAGRSANWRTPTARQGIFRASKALLTACTSAKTPASLSAKAPGPIGKRQIGPVFFNEILQFDFVEEWK